MQPEQLIRIESLKAAGQVIHLFPSFQLHELSKKIEYYIIHNEWPELEYGIDANRIRQERDTEISEQEPTDTEAL